jgi:exocyst complex component 6
LKENLDELVQTIALMQTTDPDEFFDVSQANKKYGRVDRTNGAILIEKVREGALLSPIPVINSRNETFANLSSRFGINRS